ncbi:MAG: hypothetical protein VX740_10965 [Pseudomonadota bacterium]|nr:hypothetical protein [Pseudomonadota bacterium]MEC7703208.1 hypothetical protein [Pseudomonadota bacterium]MEC9236265.1 hypothetical protein [Pseudomonadota bacterium]MED5423949.1 hypothetical protein [Pseudomonadota bacterium]MEE3323566.1 hypothetical protein [Pseudomonadota bacterium]
MAIVSGGLFSRLKHTKANMNHQMAEKPAAANDARGAKLLLARSKVSLNKREGA